MKFRIDLLNWRPDLDDVGNQGLSKADNVIHESEGWKPAYLASGGAFSTTVAASDATVLSLVAKPVGSSDDLFCAWLADLTTPTLYVGINGVTAATSATGHPLSFSTAPTSPEIYAFDVAEFGGKIVWTVEARGETSSTASTLSVAFAGYMDF